MNIQKSRAVQKCAIFRAGPSGPWGLMWSPGSWSGWWEFWGSGQEHLGLLMPSGTWQFHSACTAFNNELNRAFNMWILNVFQVGNRQWTLQNILYFKSSSLWRDTGLSEREGFIYIAGHLNSVFYNWTLHLACNNRPPSMESVGWESYSA